MIKNQQRIEQIAGMLLVAGIIAGCMYVLKPFALAILWASILCFATWPVREFLMRRFKGMRTLTAGIMTLLLAMMLLVPFVLVAVSFTENVRDGIQWLNAHKETGLGPVPAWVKGLPVVGNSISEYWSRLTTDARPLFNELQPRLEKAGGWLLRHSLSFAQGVLQLAISVVLAFFIYRDGEGMVEKIRKAFMQISGEYGNRLINVTKTTVQSVVYGMIGTGIAQGIVAGIGFVIAGVPSATMLGLFTFFLSFVPAGPPIIWIGASVWLFYKSSIGWGIFMLVYGFFVISMVDNIIRPYIISRGSKLPFIIMLVGVIGGIASFGFIGVFIGPTILALGYSLTQDILSSRTGNTKQSTPADSKIES